MRWNDCCYVVVEMCILGIGIVVNNFYDMVVNGKVVDGVFDGYYFFCDFKIENVVVFVGLGVIDVFVLKKVSLVDICCYYFD